MQTSIFSGATLSLTRDSTSVALKRQLACALRISLKVIILPLFSKAVCVHALKGSVLPRASPSGEIALSGSRLVRSTLAAVDSSARCFHRKYICRVVSLVETYRVYRKWPLSFH